MKTYLYIIVMAVTTYLVRAIPLLFMRKPIKSQYLRSFLHYVPVACLTAMTFPAIFSCTGSQISAVVGCIVAVALAWFNRGLLTVAVGAVAAVFLTQMIGF